MFKKTHLKVLQDLRREISSERERFMCTALLSLTHKNLYNPIYYW